MVLMDIDAIRGEGETDEEALVFDVSDDALERSAGAKDGRAITWLYSTEVMGNCGCPVIE
jgi:hypothetical protein